MAEESVSYLFAGLGNPGKKYEKTRHNIGFMVIEQLAKRLGWPIKEEKRFQTLVARGDVKGVKLHLIFPQTYMNESGKAIRRYLDFYRMKPEDLVVVTDDIAIDFGSIRLRKQGSTGGHNGLLSVQSSLSTQNYKRLRMGVGSPPWPGEDALASYVLSAFNAEERESLEPFVDTAVDILMRLLHEDIDRVMNDINKKKKNRSPNTDQEKQNG